MAKTCDNKSVGVIIRKKDGAFGIIKRINFPIAYAFVAGHLDGETFAVQAKNEAQEEASITVLELEELLHKQYKNPCKRDQGHGHEWKVFEATEWEGSLQASSDAKEAFWISPAELHTLIQKTYSFLREKGIELNERNRDAAQCLYQFICWR